MLKFLFIKISRVVYWLIPKEFKSKTKARNKLKDKLEDNLVEETFDNFKEHLKKSVLFEDHIKIREYAIKTSLQNDKNDDLYYLEFGVYTGKSANLFSKYVKKLYCFDSFEGLSEEWVGVNNRPKGSFNLYKKLPKLNQNIKPIIGWVEETLEDFLKKHNPKINFVHLDMDTYAPTKFTLQKIKPYLVKNAIIIFDELYNYPGWEHGEYKALKETFKEDEFRYRAFTINSFRAVIEIVK